jgi:hypothetical protein
VVRRPWRAVTDLQARDVLGLIAPSARMGLLRVARIDDHRVGVAPVVEVLDWAGLAVPDGRVLRTLQPRVSDRGPRRPMSAKVSRYRRKDPDWRDVGLALVAQGIAREGDEGIHPWSYCGWSVLEGKLRTTAG